MECPRCRDDNLPGLETCVFCGQALHEEVATPEELVPRVRAKNPLRPGRRPRPPRRRPRLPAWLRLGLWERRRVGRALRGLLAGVVPGLAAARRGDVDVALLQVAAVAVPLALVPLLWRTGWLGLPWTLLLVGWSWAPVVEIQRGLAALLARICAEERKKVLTIEDPVEFVLPRGRSLVVQQEQVRVQLSQTLRAAMSQKLLPRADGRGRLLVYELLLANDAVRNLIRENRVHQIDNVLATGGSQGMVRLDVMVRDAWLAGEITYEVAVGAVGDPAVLKA